MGGSHSTNIIDNSVSAMVSVLNTTTQKCAPTVTTDQALNFVQQGCSSSDITITHTRLSAYASVNVSCAQVAVQSADAKAQIDQIAKQMADALSQMLSLNPGSTDATNITRLSANLGLTVQNEASQIIASAVSAAQGITLRQLNGGACSIRLDFVELGALATSIARATQESTAVATATAALKQSVDQTAKAEQQGLLAGLLILVVVVALVIGGVALTGGSQVMKYLKPVLAVAIPVAAVGGGYYYWSRSQSQG